MGDGNGTQIRRNNRGRRPIGEEVGWYTHLYRVYAILYISEFSLPSPRKNHRALLTKPLAWALYVFSGNLAVKWSRYTEWQYSIEMGVPPDLFSNRPTPAIISIEHRVPFPSPILPLYHLPMPNKGHICFVNIIPRYCSHWFDSKRPKNKDGSGSLK